MTPSTPSSDSPQSRLAISRKALVSYMVRDDGRGEYGKPDDLGGSNHGQAAGEQANTQRSSAWQVLTQAVMAWWQHHPVQMAISIGRPFLGNYAEDKPLQLLVVAAGIGAGAMLIKPWRLVSVTGLAIAVLKSTKLSTTMLSLLPRAPARQQRGTPEN